MRPDEGNPLDLNNLPDDHFSRDGKQVVEDSFSVAGYRKKKSGAKDGKDECGKVYECRFCSLKFCKSQALGGHMNRHRQERETETLNKARQLVFSNDNLAAPPPPHIGCCHPITPAGYHHPAAAGNNIGGDPTLPLRFPARMFSGSSSSTLVPPPPPPAVPQPGVQPPQQPYLYSSPSRPMSFPASHYSHHQHSVNDYYVGHVLSSTSSSSPSQYGHGHPNVNYGASPPEPANYTCIGAPVGPGGGGGGGGAGGGGGGGRDGSLHMNQEEGLNWSRSYAGTQQRLDPPPSINRFQPGF